MDIEEVVKEFMDMAEHDWVGLGFISNDVAEVLGAEQSEENLELTLAVVRELLKRGLLAGDSPAFTDHFNPWPHQDADAICTFIRLEWEKRDGPPDWGDAPWFAHLRFCKATHA
jgi:hypothetical protein